VKGLSRRGDGPAPVTVAMRGLSEASGEHDLTFDWRALLDPHARTLHFRAIDRIEDALAAGRDALQAAFHSPDVRLDIDLPIPLAFLVGYEWRHDPHPVGNRASDGDVARGAPGRRRGDHAA
jgi:hypothetical protein